MLSAARLPARWDFTDGRALLELGIVRGAARDRIATFELGGPLNVGRWTAPVPNGRRLKEHDWRRLLMYIHYK